MALRRWDKRPYYKWVSLRLHFYLFIVLQSTRDKILSMNICRTRFAKDIVTEFLPPKNRDSKKVMIFCSGVPGTPNKDDVLDYWARRGYWTFFPRYRGSWESDGTFLVNSPEKDIIEVIDCLSKRFKDYWTSKSFKIKPDFITIVGSSFGGPAAILASRDKRVNKVVCVSPVVDWIAENKNEPLEKLYQLIQEAYGGAYRLDKRSWNKLKTGRFYNPVNHIDELDPTKIMIIHSRDDQIVKFKSVDQFATKLGCQFIDLEYGGHLSSSMFIGGKYYRMMKRFLRT